MSENSPDTSKTELTQDDFDWGQTGEGQTEQPKEATNGTPPKTTELDRIEFLDEEPVEEPQEEPQQVVEEPEPASAPESLLARLTALLRSPKILLASGVFILVLCVTSGFLIYAIASRPADIIETPAEQPTQPLPRELRLGNFIVPTGQKEGASFMTYSVDLTINPSLFEFYLSQEEQVRTEIFNILKEAVDDMVSGEFSDQVKHRVNSKLQRKVIVAANISSADRI